ncbi:MAG: hypothetical protein OEV44_12530 [Spirochaetota bacterium]|nr:hypothetical protein [Spirochaetota bacterium]
MFKKICILLFIFIILCQCGERDNENRTNFTQRENNAVYYYKNREFAKGKEFYEYNYMYSLTEKEANAIGDYYKLSYNEYGKLKSSEYFINNKLQSRILYFFAPDNKLTRIEEHNDKDLIYSAKFVYEGDRLKEVTHFDKMLQVIGKRVNIIKNNRVIKQENYKYDKKIMDKYFEYDANNNLLKEKVFIGLNPGNVRYYNEGKIIKEEILNNKTINYYYDSKNRLIKETHYKLNKLIYSVDFKLNKFGDIICAEFYNKDVKPHGIWLFMDDKGNINLEKKYVNGKLDWVRKKYFSDRGKLIKEEIFSEKDELIHYFTLSYDKLGNLLKWEKFNPGKKLVESRVYNYKDEKPVSRDHFKDGILLNRETYENGVWTNEKNPLDPNREANTVTDR